MKMILGVCLALVMASVSEAGCRGGRLFHGGLFHRGGSCNSCQTNQCKPVCPSRTVVATPVTTQSPCGTGKVVQSNVIERILPKFGCNNCR